MSNLFHTYSPRPIALEDLRWEAQALMMRFIAGGHDVTDVGEWQGIKGGETGRTYELEDVSFQSRIPADVYQLVTQLRPNMPWAEDHFNERVGGVPVNPPPSARYWPFTQRGHKEHLDDQGHFSHTYPERLWPKYANPEPNKSENFGVRFTLGDLEDVVELLARSPQTRQAFIPIWFPEDTGATASQRVPCTLGYHVMIRGTEMKIVYYIRSCDLLRHFVDDVYLAMRLCQWLCQRVSEKLSTPVVPRQLVMHISSLHIFEADRQTLEYQHRQLTQKRQHG